MTRSENLSKAVALLFATAIVFVLLFTICRAVRRNPFLFSSGAPPDFRSPVNVHPVVGAYRTLFDRERPGSAAAFHFSWAGRRYIACSKHQFAFQTPTRLWAPHFEDPIAILGPVWGGNDYQILEHKSDQLDLIPALEFDPAVAPAIGDPVACSDATNWVGGKIVVRDEPQWFVRLDRPMRVFKRSGSPVVSERTGTVLGVLTTANDGERGTVIGFESIEAPR